MKTKWLTEKISITPVRCNYRPIWSESLTSPDMHNLGDLKGCVYKNTSGYYSHINSNCLLELVSQPSHFAQLSLKSTAVSL